MVVYRIAKKEFIEDLSGKGAAMFGGRWNSKNTYIVYTAESRALALLESLAHIGKIQGSIFSIASIFIPDNFIDIILKENLSPYWYSNPPPDYLRIIGDNFIKNKKNLALKIPSVIVPDEYNYLLNPSHIEFNKIKIMNVQALALDKRLLNE